MQRAVRLRSTLSLAHKPGACARPGPTVSDLSKFSRNSTSVNSDPPSLLRTFDVTDKRFTGHIKVISLNSAHNANALSRGLISELSREFRALSEAGDGSQGGTRVLVLASESNRAFCAGADLKERARMSDDEIQDFLKTLRQTLNTLEKLPIPTISAINGSCMGGGLEMALATNLRVCAPNATLGLPEVQLGIIPGAGGIRRLRRLVGDSMASYLVLTSTRIPAHVASAMGLVDLSSVEGDEQEWRKMDASRLRTLNIQHAINRARHICLGGPVAVGAALRLLQAKDDDGTLEQEEYDRCVTVGRRDRDEALQAFAEKRLPEFKGAEAISSNISQGSATD